MSGLVDCMVVVANDVGSAFKQGAQAFGNATIGSIKNTFGMVKELSNGIVSGIGDTIEALENLAKEEKEVYKQAFNQYQSIVQQDQQKQKEYLNQVITSSKFKEFNLDTTKVVEDLSKDNKTSLVNINEMFKFALSYQKSNDAIIELSNDERIIKYKGSLNKLKEDFINEVNHDNFSSLSTLNMNMTKIINELSLLIKDKMNQESEYDVSKMNEIFISLSDDVGDSYVYLFNNELTQLLNKEDTNESLKLENKLVELKKSMLDYAFKLDKLENIEGIEECKNMIKYVYETLTNKDLTTANKLQRVELRVNALKDQYLKCEKNNQEIFDLKNKYDAAYWRNTSFRKYLNINVNNNQFKALSAKEDIRQLEKENEELLKKCREKEKREYLRKTLKEAMIENELEYVDSKEQTYGDNTIQQDIYHIDNGNVVVVSLNNKGALNYYVSQVDIDGISNDDSKTVESMHKFCSKYKNIEKRLKEKGINSDLKRRLDPSVKYVKTIEVNEKAKETIKNKIKKSKFIKSELKSKHVGD